MKLWGDKELTELYSRNCKMMEFDDIEKYGEKLMRIYQ